MRMKLFDRSTRWLFLVSIAFSCCVASWALACQVPVFRYALERWSADHYEIVVLHDAEMDTQDQDRLKELRGQVENSTNANVRVTDIRESKDAKLQSLWKKHAIPGNSLLAILYPQSNHEIPDRLLAVSPFHSDTLKNLIDSPIRREIVKRLLGGQSAVWLFVPCGKPEKDEPAMKLLLDQLKEAPKKLKLPAIDDVVDNAKVQDQIDQLRVEFSAITLNRDDHDERHLLNMLLRSESDLLECDEPLAFPVLGRGRVLYALVGKGINAEMIFSGCQFIVGACSCQVKAQNPGFDLLMQMNWELAVGETKISDPLPEAKTESTELKIPPGRKTKVTK